MRSQCQSITVVSIENPFLGVITVFYSTVSDKLHCLKTVRWGSGSHTRNSSPTVLPCLWAVYPFQWLKSIQLLNNKPKLHISWSNSPVCFLFNSSKKSHSIMLIYLKQCPWGVLYPTRSEVSHWLWCLLGTLGFNSDTVLWQDQKSGSMRFKYASKIWSFFPLVKLPQ